MSRSSGFASSTVTVRGSSAMPQIGQLPGSARTISGCIGQVYSVLACGERGRLGIERHATLGTGARPDLPHLGAHRTNVGPRVFCGRLAKGDWELAAGLLANGFASGRPRETSPDPIVISDGDARIFSGFAWNFWRQPAQQKKYSLPLCEVLKRAVAGFTSIPQTGSFACALAEGCGVRDVPGVRCSMAWLPEVYSESRFRHDSVGVDCGQLGCGQAPSQIALGGILALLDTQRVILEPYSWEK
jgi:hypothetical protein